MIYVTLGIFAAAQTGAAIYFAASVRQIVADHDRRITTIEDWKERLFRPFPKPRHQDGE